jgi:diguanylate cyclase (GGDEF)-like protein
VGDVVLRQLGALLRKEARTEDVICRINGEEFALIAPDTTSRSSLNLAERLRSAVHRARFSSGSVSVALTVSLGVAERAPGMERIDELMRAADRALEEAKRAGCNRVSAAGLPAAAA